MKTSYILALKTSATSAFITGFVIFFVGLVDKDIQYGPLLNLALLVSAGVFVGVFSGFEIEKIKR